MSSINDRLNIIILKSHLAIFAVCSEVSRLAIKDNIIIFTLTELIAVKAFDWSLISLFELVWSKASQTPSAVI